MKKLIATLSFVALALTLGASAFGQTIISRTTLSAAITSTSSQANTFRLASTTGIVANVTMLFIDGEVDSVNAVTPTTVSVTRGASSRVSTHLSGTQVWFGPPNQFQSQSPVGYPFGSCSRSTALYLPYIDVNNYIISDCLGGIWVQGEFGNPSNTKFRVLVADQGYVAYTGINTNGTALASTTTFCSELDLPYNKLLTGLAVLNGTTVGTDKRVVILYDASGNPLANSATAGALSASASVYQQFAFTANYFAVGPAQYFACVQSNGATDTVRMLLTGFQDNLLTKGVTGTVFGTVGAITVPTTFTTAVGPYLYAY